MPNLEFARNKTDRLIEKFSGSFMSNAKWVKLLSSLSSIDGLDCKAIVKLVWDEEERDVRLDEGLEFNFDFYDNSMESMISGNPKGWYDYKEIEWLSISGDQEQISNIQEKINQLGKFELATNQNSIIVFCYK
ncbi:hypothetical protein [Shewanella algae]|uniref:hypothetical protein n=1 Tax=Shewanella algae TaxID=38313 RepID=UPI001AAC8F8F|nr:hypothetical protein [Shewanella algae]MBO2650815.1 hypothetical protein [Shewanella algae]